MHVLRVFGMSQDKGVPLNLFLNVVGQLKFRGTSVLFRLPRSPVTRSTPIPPDAPQPPSPAPSPNTSLNRRLVQSDNTAAETIKEGVLSDDMGGDGVIGDGEIGGGEAKKARVESTETSSNSDKEEAMECNHSDEAAASDSIKSIPAILILGEDDSNETISEGEGEMEDLPGQDYTIATHFVKVRRSGTLSDVTTIWDLQGTDCISGSLDSIVASKPGFDRLPSINAFDRVREMCSVIVIKIERRRRQ